MELRPLECGASETGQGAEQDDGPVDLSAIHPRVVSQPEHTPTRAAASTTHRVDPGLTTATGTRRLKLLSYNVQAGIHSRQYSDYFTNSWKHVLPHPERLANLTRIGQLLHQFDLVGLQEVDAGSLRSAYIDQIQYLARYGAFAHWYRQINRNLGPFAQHSNGILCRLQPQRITEHKLPGLPGRGAVVAELALSDQETLAVAIVHLALGWRARQRQLDYLVALSEQHPYLVIMGDFNCGCDSKGLRAMVKQADMRGLDCELKTFPSWRPTHNLDHILISRPLKLVAARVVDYALSDHLPISMTIELPEGVAFSTPAIEAPASSGEGLI